MTDRHKWEHCPCCGLHESQCAGTVNGCEPVASTAAVPAAPPATPDLLDANFLRHALSVIEGTIKYCIPKHHDEEIAHYGGQCLAELSTVADELRALIDGAQK